LLHVEREAGGEQRGKHRVELGEIGIGLCPLRARRIARPIVASAADTDRLLRHYGSSPVVLSAVANVVESACETERLSAVAKLPEAVCASPRFFPIKL